ncbi:MAG: hypothetical protein KCHDKBKB_00123 [Elusimicrobia bacterium]|nr:hypothetical protein [Elusimicrobiota bacterium]
MYLFSMLVRTSLFIKGFCLALMLMALSSFSFAADIGSLSREPFVILSPAINVGYNRLLDGYDGYKDLGNVGFDLYFHNPPEKYSDNSISYDWKDRFAFRLSLDYFPLQVPEGLYNTTEDIYALSGAVVYKFIDRDNPLQKWIPFLSLGAGVYQDRVTIDTPATGEITGKEDRFGLNASLGAIAPEIKLIIPVKLIPEIRYHRIKGVNDYASNLTFQLGVSYWPRSRKTK